MDNIKPFFYQSKQVINTEVDLANPAHVALASLILNLDPKAEWPRQEVARLMKAAGLKGSAMDITVVDRDMDTPRQYIVNHYITGSSMAGYEGMLSHLVVWPPAWAV